MNDAISTEEQIKISFYEKLPSRNLVFATFIVILGSSFHIGYNGALLNVPHEKLAMRITNILITRGSQHLAESGMMVKLIWASYNAVYFLGGTLGTVISAAVIDKYDRGRVIYVTCIMSIFASFVMVVAFFMERLYPIVFARYVVGIISGVFSCSVPIYLSEIAPVRTRGMVCACFSISQAAGILVAYLSTNTEYGGDNQWLYLILVPIIPIILQFILMGHCRSSPRFLLIKKQQYDRAFKSLQWFRHTEHLHLLEQELDEMAQELPDSMVAVSGYDGWRHLASIKYVRKPILVSILVMCAQQFSGVNVFLLYSTHLFEEAGVPIYFCHAGTITMGVVLFFMSILSMLLVEITGRRMLILYGYVGIFVFSFMHYLTFLYNETLEGPLECVGAVAGLFIWFVIIHFALGPNSVPWILTTELFNQACRPKAVTVAAFCYWLASTMVALVWPLTEILGPHLFLLSLIVQLIFFFLLYKYVPETSNKTITEITAMYM